MFNFLHVDQKRVGIGQIGFHVITPRHVVVVALTTHRRRPVRIEQAVGTRGTHFTPGGGRTFGRLLLGQGWIKIGFFVAFFEKKALISNNQLTFDIQIKLLMQRAETKYKFSTFLNSC